MTTTGLMLLAQRGLVDLDAPLNDYLEGARIEGKAGDAQGATVRRVADHSAGLPTFYRFFYADEPCRRPPMDEVIQRYAKLFSPPGERYHYSNLGYGLLDLLIERLSGRPYAEFMADEVFAPLGMRDSSIGAPAEGGEAVAYGPDGVPYPHYTFDHPGGSAAYASIEDLLAFGRFHLGQGPGLLSPDVLAEMHRPSILMDETRGYGLGWASNRDRLGAHIVQHMGQMGGVTTALTLVPELDLVVAIVTNGQSALAVRSSDDAVAAVVPVLEERLRAERAALKPEDPGDPVPASFFGRWEGTIETYNERLPFMLDIREGDGAIARLGREEHPVEDLQITNGRGYGVFDGDVRTDDAARYEYRVHLDLKPRGDLMNGAALTLSRIDGNGGGAPGKRYGNALPYWTELRRAKMGSKGP